MVQFEDADGDGLADFSAGDYLYFYDTSLLQGSYFSGSGRLRVKGRAPFYEYEESLRVIGYRGYDSFMRGLTSGGNQLMRNISITVFDGNGLESDKVGGWVGAAAANSKNYETVHELLSCVVCVARCACALKCLPCGKISFTASSRWWERSGCIRKTPRERSRASAKSAEETESTSSTSVESRSCRREI